MAYVVTKSSSGSAELVTLHHGSALVHTNSILIDGVNEERLRRACIGAFAFCVSRAFPIAKEYALQNPLVRMEGHEPAVLTFKLPVSILQNFQAKKLAAWVPEDQAYEFLPETFPIINHERTDVSVQIVTETKIKFEQE
jgi:hypothetical protein